MAQISNLTTKNYTLSIVNILFTTKVTPYYTYCFNSVEYQNRTVDFHTNREKKYKIFPWNWMVTFVDEKFITIMLELSNEYRILDTKWCL